MIGLILSYFGYAKVPVESVRLAMWIKDEAGKSKPDFQKIQLAAKTLEDLFRSARKLTNGGSMNKLEKHLKRLWSNRAVKTVVVSAAGGAFGAIQPMLAAGTFVLNSSTLHMASVGAMSALAALYVHRPEKKS